MTYDLRMSSEAPTTAVCTNYLLQMGDGMLKTLGLDRLLTRIPT